MPEAPSLLKQWTDFYVIIGSSAGALTGLQFVVIALIAEIEDAGMSEVRAFATPTIVHFCVVLLISSIASAPWPAEWNAAFSLVICGVVGIVYALRVVSHARRQSGYAPDVGDWVWYMTFPPSAYALLLIGGLLLFRPPQTALFLVAAAALALLFNGIHNAWDSVTYIAINQAHAKGNA